MKIIYKTICKCAIIIILMSGTFARLDHACRKGDLKTVKRFINKTYDYETLLYWACIGGHLDVVKYLVNLGARFHDKNEFALRWSAFEGHLHLVQYFVEIGADIHVDNEKALCMAIQNGKFNVVEYLVNLGANIYVNNNDPLSYAHYSGRQDIIQYLLLRGSYLKHIVVSFDVLIDIYSLGQFELVHKLIHNNNCYNSDEHAEQFNLIKLSVNKIIERQNRNYLTINDQHSDIMFMFK